MKMEKIPGRPELLRQLSKKQSVAEEPAVLGPLTPQTILGLQKTTPVVEAGDVQDIVHNEPALTPNIDYKSPANESAPDPLANRYQSRNNIKTLYTGSNKILSDAIAKSIQNNTNKTFYTFAASKVIA